MELIQSLNHEALTCQDSSIALPLLTRALELLHYQANCGKVVERNLIVTVLYNLAALNQAICNLEQATQYLEACIYNLQNMLQNETDQILLIKRMHFLSLIQLQYCGLLSQLGQHQLGSSIANNAILTLHELFEISCQYNDSQSLQARQLCKSYKGEFVYEEFDFKTLLLRRAAELLRFTKNLLTLQESALQDLGSNLLREKQLKLTVNKLSPRSMIGVLNENEWLNTFQISNVLHLKMLTYDDVCLKGEILYEFSQRVLVEKLLLLSVANFLIATENRFLKKEKSEIYHLKSISIAANILPESTPYLEHITQSFLTHYHPHLETIIEEQSFVDQSAKVSLKRRESQVQNKENQNDHLKQLIESLSKDKQKKQQSIQKTLTQLQNLKNKLNKSKQELSLKRFKTEPSLHFEKNEKNCKQILQLLKQ